MTGVERYEIVFYVTFPGAASGAFGLQLGRPPTVPDGVAANLFALVVAGLRTLGVLGQRRWLGGFVAFVLFQSGFLALFFYPA